MRRRLWRRPAKRRLAGRLARSSDRDSSAFLPTRRAPPVRQLAVRPWPWFTAPVAFPFRRCIAVPPISLHAGSITMRPRGSAAAIVLRYRSRPAAFVRPCVREKLLRGALLDGPPAQ